MKMGWVVVLALAFVGAVGRSAAQEPVAIELATVQTMTPVLNHIQLKGYKNVGVLKFLVRREGEREYRDNVGAMNLTLAKQFEVALIMCQTVATRVGVVENASAVAATIPGADHRSPEGCGRLFDARYPLAWGKEKVQVDAFLTGLVDVSRNLRQLQIQVEMIDRQTRRSEIIRKTVARNSPSRLSEMGESFGVRGAFDGGTVTVVGREQDRPVADGAAFQSAALAAGNQAKHPLQFPQPVELEIRYDGQPVTIEFRDGKAFVAEPKEGQRVELALSHRGKDERFAIVLKVNGVNTLFKQRQPDFHCDKWVLPRGSRPLIVGGFQLDQGRRESFRVASKAESQSRALDYGDDVGMITMTVFAERRARPDAPGLSTDVIQATTLQQARLPENRDSYEALRSALDAMNSGPRGLVVEGERTEFKTQTVAFDADPTPVLSVAVVYYKR
jgi:hypothetical protein